MARRMTNPEYLPSDCTKCKWFDMRGICFLDKKHPRSVALVKDRPGRCGYYKRKAVG